MSRSAAIVFGVLAAAGSIVSVPFGLLLYRQLGYSGYYCALEAPGYGTLQSDTFNVIPLGVRCDWLIENVPVTVVVANWPLTIALALTLAFAAIFLISLIRWKAPMKNSFKRTSTDRF